MSDEPVTTNLLEPEANPIPGTTEPAPSLLEPPADPAPAPEPITAEAIQLPEGFEPAPELIQEFLGVLNNGELSPVDRANALVSLQTKALAAASEANSQAWNTMQDEWQAEVKADPELGGAKLQPTLASVSKLISEYGSDELLGVMSLTGAGNNIHVLRFLSKVASKLTEGGSVQGAPAATEVSAAKRMYPSMKG